MVALKHGPAPWRREDHKEIGYKIVDAKGSPVCYLHYPKEIEDHANQRLLLRAPELLSRLKGISMLVRATQLFKGAAEKLMPLVEAERLVSEIEFTEPLPKPPEKERL
jgi:hypothetical protein